MQMSMGQALAGHGPNGGRQVPASPPAILIKNT